MRPRIAVIGVGGAGGNAINNMIAAGLTGVEFMVANTDAQALAASSAEKRIQLGTNLTEGLGAGSKPEIGEAAAEEAIDDIRAALSDCHVVFIAAGMGGGTGTGAASVIARVAKELGILTVAVVTKPFQFEGSRRMRVAEAGIAELRRHVDTLLVIPNQNLFRIATERTTFAEAFVLADQVLYSGIACIVDLIVKEGLINLDLADVRTVLSGMGTAMMGTGEAAGEQRAIVAAEEAIVNPLLDDVTLKGAKSLLLSITGGPDLTLWEVDEAANRVRQEVDVDANIIVGATFDEALGNRVRVSIVASGMARSSHARSDEAGWAQRKARASQAGDGEDFRHRLTAAIGEAETGAPEGGWRAGEDVLVREVPAGAARAAREPLTRRQRAGLRDEAEARQRAAGGNGAVDGGRGESDAPARKLSWFGRLARAHRVMREGEEMRSEPAGKAASEPPETELPVFFGHDESERER
jgi:cell division protein FtsZ